jgi:hypothetical protein
LNDRTRHLAAALTGLGLGLAALGPGLAPGFVLSYDMVFVPDPAFTRMTFGLTGIVPRHVPSDAFVTALAAVVPSDAVQKLVVLAIFVVACASAASLVPSRRLPPRLAAGVCYAWNPFVAERLLLGQWALLLGYAALPWVVAAAARTDEPGGGRRLVRALIPAAIGGFAALTVTAITALTVAVATGRTRAGLRVLAAVGVLSLPWLIPGALRPSGVPGDGTAVDLFAARADTPFGTIGSLLLLGGVWNGETVPSGYGMAVTATIWLVVVVVALLAYGKWCREPAWRRGLAVAAAIGFVVAALGAVAAGALEAVIDLWPGFAVLRDGQQYVAPLAVLVAVGFGTAADQAAEARWPGVAAAAIAVPVLLLPTGRGRRPAGRPVSGRLGAGEADHRRRPRAGRRAGPALGLVPELRVEPRPPGARSAAPLPAPPRHRGRRRHRRRHDRRTRGPEGGEARAGGPHRRAARGDAA